MAIGIKISLNEKLFLRDPQDSTLGKKIIKHSILLIDEIGFESFNFKKLAMQMESTEASVYRYFENKHMLLIYLVSWYWNWVEYRFSLKTQNIESAQQRLEIFIELITHPVMMDDTFVHVDEITLHRIVISESSKAYLTKEVDEANKEGFYLGYKRLVNRVCEFVKEINPNFEFEHTLISTIFEGIHHQKYFAN